jgi:hypothetical protein
MAAGERVAEGPSSTIGAAAMGDPDAGRMTEATAIGEGPEAIASDSPSLKPESAAGRALVVDPTLSVRQRLALVAAIGIAFGLIAAVADGFRHGFVGPLGTSLIRPVAVAAAFWISAAAFAALTARHPRRWTVYWITALVIGNQFNLILLQDSISKMSLRAAIGSLFVGFVGTLAMSLAFFLLHDFGHDPKKAPGKTAPADGLYDPHLDGRP